MNTEKLYKGYVPTKQKQAQIKFKNVSPESLRTLEQVKDLPEYAGILAENTILIDLDDSKQAEVLMDIVKDKKLKCRVIDTTRGKHFLFENTTVKKCYTGVQLACGLQADIKVGLKNSYEVLKYNNELRCIEWDSKEIEKLPFWLYPIEKTKISLFDLPEGSRNDDLFRYELPLQTAGLSNEQIKQTLQIANKYVIHDPLSEDELSTIIRDSALQKPSFYEGSTFLHNRMAEYLASNEHVILIGDMLHIYDNGIYKADIKAIQRKIASMIPTLKDRQIQEVIKRLFLIAPVRDPTEPTLIAFRNGIYDLKTRQLLPFSPEYIITNRIPWDYNPNAESPALNKAMDAFTCNDAEVRALLEEMAGYCFYRKNNMRKFFILTGSGSNGKSTFLKILQKTLGAENVTAIDLGHIADRFNKASLLNKLANIGDDISDQYIEETADFKKMASGESIHAEYKGAMGFDFVPYFKMIFSANEIPRIKDKTGAVEKRMIIIPFDAVFDENDPSYDPDILEKITDQNSIEAFIRYGLQGLNRLYQKKRFTIPERVSKKLDEYRSYNNPILSFMDEQDDDYWFRNSVSDIYLAWSTYCNENGYRAGNINSFSRDLTSRLQKRLQKVTKVTSYVRKINGKSVRMYRRE